MTTRTTPLALVAALVLSAAAPAAAQPNDDKAAARAHFQSAEAHYRAGNYRAAINGYAESHKLFPAPILLFNIGLCHERLDEKREAIAKYKEYLAAEPGGAKAGEARTRAEALAKLIEAQKATVKERIARLRAEGRQGELAAALTELYALDADAELIFDIAVAREDAGERDQAIAEYDRYLKTESPKRADEARRRRQALSTDRDGQKPDPDGQKPDPDGQRPDPDRQRPDPITDAPPPSRSMVWPLAASGVTAAALITGTLFGLRASGAHGDLDDELAQVDPPVDSNDPRFEDGPRDATVANIALGVGLAGAAISGYLWYRYLSAGSAPADSAGDTAVSVGPSRDGVEVGVKVRF